MTSWTRTHMRRWKACCWGRRAVGGLIGWLDWLVDRWSGMSHRHIYAFSFVKQSIDRPPQIHTHTHVHTDALAGGGGGGMSSSLAARGLESHRGVNLVRAEGGCDL